jgi:hypothetical protein
MHRAVAEDADADCLDTPTVAAEHNKRPRVAARQRERVRDDSGDGGWGNVDAHLETVQ